MIFRAVIQGLILIGLISFNQAINVTCNAANATIDISSDDVMNFGLMGSDEWYLSSPDAAPASPSPVCARTAMQISLTTALFECGGKVAVLNGDDNTTSITWLLRKWTTSSYERGKACYTIRCVFDVYFVANLVIDLTPGKSTVDVTTDTLDFNLTLTIYNSNASRSARGSENSIFHIPSAVYGLLLITDATAPDSLSVLVDDCYVTPMNANSPRYDIIENGVEVTADANGGIEYEGGMESRAATFQFNSFKWDNVFLTTYVIRCTGKVCDQSGSSTCDTNPFSRRRRRRDAADNAFHVVSKTLMFVEEEVPAPE